MATKTKGRSRAPRRLKGNEAVLGGAFILLVFGWLVWLLLDRLTGLEPGSPTWMTIFGAAVGVAVWETVIKPGARALVRGR